MEWWGIKSMSSKSCTLRPQQIMRGFSIHFLSTASRSDAHHFHQTKKENRMFDSTRVAFILPLRQLLGAWRGRQQGDLPQLVKQSSSWPQSASDVPARWQQSQTRYLNTNHCKVIQNKKRDRRIKRERTENRQDQYLEEREKEKKEMIVVLCWGISVWATERESGKMTTMTTRHPPFFEWITPLWDSFFFFFLLLILYFSYSLSRRPVAFASSTGCDAAVISKKTNSKWFLEQVVIKNVRFVSTWQSTWALLPCIKITSYIVSYSQQ